MSIELTKPITRADPLAAGIVGEPPHGRAALWRGWMPDSADIHVTVLRGQLRMVRRGVRAHRARTDCRSSRRYGLLVSSPLDTFCDLAALHLDLVDLVVAGDSLIKFTALEPGDLVKAAAVWSGKGARFARQAAALVRTGVDSAAESQLRMLIVLAGLPEPVVNRIQRRDNGEWERRFELCYPELKLPVAYDGGTTTALVSEPKTGTGGKRWNSWVGG